MPRPRRHLCRACLQHPAGYFTRFGKFKAASDHPLCMRCYRSERDRLRARALAERFVVEQDGEAWIQAA